MARRLSPATAGYPGVQPGRNTRLICSGSAKVRAGKDCILVETPSRTMLKVLASVDGAPVLVREGVRLAASFHPELTDDVRLHRWWLDEIDGAIS